MAVFLLPGEMFSFFKQHLSYIEEHAVDPDKRRYIDDNEAIKHFIDLEHFINHVDEVDSLKLVPIDSLKSLKQYGTLPWTLHHQYHLLVYAFQLGNQSYLLRMLAHIGHYIADAHVPLHTTKNYNGQLTGQRGIHALWETEIPKISAGHYDFMLGRAKPISSLRDFIWEIVLHSHQMVGEVLDKEKSLSIQVGPDHIFRYVRTKSSIKKTYQEQYIRDYEHSLDGMVERQMQLAISAVASFWYTAWIEAGQPDLSAITEESEIKQRQDSTHKKTPSHQREKGSCR